MSKSVRNQVTRVLALLALIVLLNFFGRQNESTSHSALDVTSSETSTPKREVIPDVIMQHEGLPAVSIHTSVAATSSARTVQRHQQSQMQVSREILQKNRCQSKETWSEKRVTDFWARLVTDGWHTYRHGLLII